MKEKKQEVKNYISESNETKLEIEKLKEYIQRKQETKNQDVIFYIESNIIQNISGNTTRYYR